MSHRTYRYFRGKPLYGFGFGLSYTTFSYSGLKLSSGKLHAGDTLTVEADLKNTGAMAGEEVAELYLTPPQGRLAPALALSGFKRVHLVPGGSTHVSFTLDPRQLSQVDEKGRRIVEAGLYRVSLGGTQPGERREQNAEFSIEGKLELPE